MRPVLKLLPVLFAGCGGVTAVPPDAQTDAAVDAGMDADAAGDAGAELDAGSPDVPVWDGEELPPVRWTLPACAVWHGVLDRYIYHSEIDRRRLDHVATGSGRIVVDYSAELLELTSGSVEPLEVAMPEEVTSWDLSWFEVNETQLRADARYTSDGVSHPSQLLVVDGDRVEFTPFSDLDFGWLEATSELDSAGNWRTLGNLRGTGMPGLHDIVVNRDLEVTRSVFLADDLATAVARVPFSLVRGDGGSMLVRAVKPEDSPETVEMIPFDETRAEPPVLLDDDAFYDDPAVDYVRAAADGDVVVILYRFAPFHGGYHQRIVEVSLETGEIVRGPETFGADRISRQIDLLSAPGGGIDVVQQPASFGGSRYVRENSELPLHIYPGIGRPLRLEEHTPRQLGAGAYVVSYDAQRDGDRLVVVWKEWGPTTDEEDPADRRTAIGFYWAVLECDS